MGTFAMRKICRTLLLVVMLLPSVVLSQTDFEATKARAEAGEAKAQFELGINYYNGTGVEKSYQEAIKWIRFAAEQGNVDSQALLGNLYFDGAGIPQNYEEAYKWYSLAAKDGWSNGAQFRLGYLYYNGLGVSKNLVKAYAWFSVAAVQGDTTAEQRRDRYKNELSTEELIAAQRLATRCFESNFKDCGE